MNEFSQQEGFDTLHEKNSEGEDDAGGAIAKLHNEIKQKRIKVNQYRQEWYHMEEIRKLYASRGDRWDSLPHHMARAVDQENIAGKELRALEKEYYLAEWNHKYSVGKQRESALATLQRSVDLKQQDLNQYREQLYQMEETRKTYVGQGDDRYAFVQNSMERVQEQADIVTRELHDLEWKYDTLKREHAIKTLQDNMHRQQEEIDTYKEKWSEMEFFRILYASRGDRWDAFPDEMSRIQERVDMATRGLQAMQWEYETKQREHAIATQTDRMPQDQEQLNRYNVCPRPCRSFCSNPVSMGRAS